MENISLLEGDIVQIETLTSRKRRSWIFTLSKGGSFFTHLGTINHDDCIGRSFGDILKLTGGQVLLLKPTPRDLIRNFHLKTQILYEDDCAVACSLAGVTPGMRVGEAGSGSGALTTFLASTVRPRGHVYSFDNNKVHLDNARSNVVKAGLEEFVTFTNHDVLEPLEVRGLDAFFLDFSTPYRAIKTVAQSLRGGGRLICFVPSWGQVEQTVAQIQESSYFVLRETLEITRRNFVVDPKKHIMRPVFRDLVYSGILIHAIRIIPRKEISR
ncbi:MAG: tRNA (adenine-N1)-methyltransferase [Candidatus Heimdallarchaeota archaeon]